MKKIQYLALVMSVVTFLSLVGVGFSIWYNLDVILPNGDGVVTGNENVITAYAVDRSSDILKCTGNISMFSYSALSFVGGDSGTIAVPYTIDMSKTDILKDSTRLTFSLTYEEGTIRALDANGDNTNDGLFTAINGTWNKVEATISINNSDGSTTTILTATPTVSDDRKTVSFTCEYSKIAKQITNGTFVVTYTLTIPETYSDGTTVGNFRRAFGQYLLSNKVNDDGSTTTTKFIVIAEVTIS